MSTICLLQIAIPTEIFSFGFVLFKRIYSIFAASLVSIEMSPDKKDFKLRINARSEKLLS